MIRTTPHKKISRQDGFTLIELLIYISISTVVIVTLTTFVSDVSLNATRSKLDSAVQDNARLIINKLTQDIRTADSITSVNPTQLVLVNGGTSIAYTWDPIDETVYYNAGSGPQALTANHIRVSSMAFADDGKAINIDLTVEQANPHAAENAQADITLHSSIAPRVRLY